MIVVGESLHISGFRGILAHWFFEWLFYQLFNHALHLLIKDHSRSRFKLKGIQFSIQVYVDSGFQFGSPAFHHKPRWGHHGGSLVCLALSCVILRGPTGLLAPFGSMFKDFYYMWQQIFKFGIHISGMRSFLVCFCRCLGWYDFSPLEF